MTSTRPQRARNFLLSGRHQKSSHTQSSAANQTFGPLVRVVCKGLLLFCDCSLPYYIITSEYHTVALDILTFASKNWLVASVHLFLLIHVFMETHTTTSVVLITLFTNSAQLMNCSHRCPHNTHHQHHYWWCFTNLPPTTLYHPLLMTLYHPLLMTLYQPGSANKLLNIHYCRHTSVLYRFCWSGDGPLCLSLLGILLWELWTGGKTPYPTFTNSQVLDEVLMGYRLEKPKLCPPEIYDLMRKCWLPVSCSVHCAALFQPVKYPLLTDKFLLLVLHLAI